MPGRSIRLFLIDGVSSGLRTAELGLSTIKALVVPRALLVAAGQRPEVKRTGIYILIGRDADTAGNLRVYIGEADTVYTRLTRHDSDPTRDFWEEAVVFVSKDANLTKSHGRYLEARLIALAKQANRCTVENATQPLGQGMLPEADEVEMEEFIAQARLLLGTLGYDLFSTTTVGTTTSFPAASNQRGNIDLSFVGQDFDAKCTVDATAGQFVVRKGSFARKAETTTLLDSYRAVRAQLLATGVLTEESNRYRFNQDYAFTSGSTAAKVVCGYSIAGPVAWKLPDGTTYGEWLAGQLPNTSTASDD